MQPNPHAGATAPRRFTLLDAFGQQAAAFTCAPAELPDHLAARPIYGLTPQATAQLTECLSEMDGTGTYTARTHVWTLRSEAGA